MCERAAAWHCCQRWRVTLTTTHSLQSSRLSPNSPAAAAAAAGTLLRSITQWRQCAGPAATRRDQRDLKSGTLARIEVSDTVETLHITTERLNVQLPSATLLRENIGHVVHTYTTFGATGHVPLHCDVKMRFSIFYFNFAGHQIWCMRNEINQKRMSLLPKTAVR